MKNNRPKPITVIGWYLIIAYAFALVSIPMALLISTVQETLEATGAPVELSLGFTLLSSIVMIFSGISILKGLKLGRYVALAYMPAAMLVGFFLNGFQGSVIVGIIIYIVIFYFLSRKDAQMYFNHEWIKPADVVLETKEPENEPVGSNVLVYERVVKGSAGETLLTVDIQDASEKKQGMARKIIGTVLFFFGDTILINFIALVLPIIMSLPQEQGMMVGGIAFVVMLFTAGPLILTGFLVWGFKRGRGLIALGTFVTGAWTVLGALGLIMIQFMPQYRELQELQQNQDIGLTSMGLYMMIAGIFNLIIAACLSHEFKRFVSVHIIRRAEKREL